MHLSSLSWKLVTNMICLFSKYFWNEAKCVVEPNSLDFKNLNNKLSVLVITVWKVGYKHFSTNQVRLLHNNYNEILIINCLKISRKKRKCSIYLKLVKIAIRTLLQEHKSLMPKSAIENAVWSPWKCLYDRSRFRHQSVLSLQKLVYTVLAKV